MLKCFSNKNLASQTSFILIITFVFITFFQSYPLYSMNQYVFEKSINKAKEYYNKGKYKKAIKKFEKILKNTKNNNHIIKIYKEIAYVRFLKKDLIFSEHYIKKILISNKNFKILPKEYSFEFSKFFQKTKLSFIELNKKKAEHLKNKKVIQKIGKKKKKKFPVFLAILGVAAIAALVYFFIIKKLSLTVNVSEGIQGSPEKGKYEYKRGKKVDYNYTLRNGYTGISVKIDGKKVPASGTIIMDKNHTIEALSEKGSYAERVYNSIEWINIPSGEFLMGDNFNTEPDDSRPVHKVYLDSYYIAKYEITFEQYDLFCEDTGREKPHDAGFGRDQKCVINVNWDDANAFCEWLSTKTGENIELPTEAQWEKAARGTDQRRYPWGNEPPNGELCNGGAILGRTQAVGLYPLGVSPYGVHDMAGNAFEWCSDWMHSNYYSISPYKNPKGPSWGTAKTIRGGGWYYGFVTNLGNGNVDVFCTATRRSAFPSIYGARYDNYGFRVVKNN